MKRPAGTSHLTILSSSLITVFTVAVLHFFTQLPPGGIIITGLLLLAFSFLTIQLALHFFLIRRIRSITGKISALIRKKPAVSSNAYKGTTDLDMLDAQIRALVKEKSDEIAQLKKLEQYRREFLGNVAHELRTPIFTIQGYIHTLKDGALYDEEVNKSFLEKTARNVDNLTNLVEDLMTISRIESGSHPMRKSSFDIQDLARETFESLDLMSGKKNISLVLRNAGKKSLRVYADKEMIRQVMVNLMANAIKYGRENGQVP
jgi:two-component system, OmpR family, phosphate regulon sensor histidine kinase PhoR